MLRKDFISLIEKLLACDKIGRKYCQVFSIIPCMTWQLFYKCIMFTELSSLDRIKFHNKSSFHEYFIDYKSPQTLLCDICSILILFSLHLMISSIDFKEGNININKYKIIHKSAMVTNVSYK